jgi:hypothetical protein
VITLRKSAERGQHQEDWLSSYHTFSFHTYNDPRHMGFRNLRVINEDRVSGGRGFGMHPHQDMEIISLVLEGKLEHRDNLGNREIIGPYELQRITAGTGILHSETNPAAEAVHFLQIWILPERQGLEAGYEIRKFPLRPKNELTLLASPDGRQDSARIRQDVLLYYGHLECGTSMEYRLTKDRHAWLQIIGGALECRGLSLRGGDGAAVSDEESLFLVGGKETEFLLFDLN